MPPKVPDENTAGPLGTLQGGSAAVPAPTGATVPVPASIASDCSVDVSKPLRHFLNKLPDNSTVLVGAQACYRVDKGMTLKNDHGLTIYGGTFTSDVTLPPGNPKKPIAQGPVFNLLGGSDISLEHMKINGQNPGGYHPALAFAAAIDVQGTEGVTIRGVTITHAFGDGITFSPLRGGSDHRSGQILNATTNAVVDGVTINGEGRQAVTLGSVSGAQISDLVVENPGLNTFDVEADQGNEGATDVTIDGCTSSGGGLFFANGGAGSGPATHDITVAHCAMAEATAGDAVLVYNTKQSRKHPRGPFDFVADVFECGHSTSVACVELSGASVTVQNSVLHFPAGTVHEAVYHVGRRSTAVFTNDAISGYSQPGHVSKNSTLHVSGGHWVSVTGVVAPT